MIWPLIIFLFIFWRGKSHGQHLGMPHQQRYLHYCLLSCYEGEMQIPNVACYASPCLPSYMCGNLHKRFPLNDTEREYIVHRHNEIRNAVAATDMMVMSYDKELEFLASCWANQCMESPKPSHARDRCRATTTYSDNGQSQWANASTDLTIDWSDIQHLENAITSWRKQSVYVTKELIRSYRYHPNESYEYYTQMVWSETYLVGCGRTRFSTGRYLGVVIVCNYSPGGNEEHVPVYGVGNASCSRYHDMTVNDMYSNLCGDQRPISEDKYVPKFELDAVRSTYNSFLLLIALLLKVVIS